MSRERKWKVSTLAVAVAVLALPILLALGPTGTYMYLRPQATPATQVAAPREGYIAYNDTANVVQFYDGSTWANIGVAGSGTLDQAYDSGGAGAGRSITVDTGDVDLNLTVAASSLEIDAAAAVAITDALIFNTSDAGGTITDAIDCTDAGITNCLNVGARAITGTTGTITYTNFTVSAAGAVTAASIADSAAGGTLNLDGNAAGGVTIGSTSTGGITLSRATTVTTGGLTVSAGGLTVTGDETHSGNQTFTVSATVGTGVLVDGSTVTTGDALRIEYDAAASGAGFGAISVTEDGVEIWRVAEDGNMTIGGTAEGTAAITVTAGDVTLTDGDLTVSSGEFVVTAGLTDITGPAASAVDLIDVTRANDATDGDVFDINLGNAVIAGDGLDVAFGTGAATGAGLRVAFGGAATGEAVALDMTTAVGAEAILITGAGARVDRLIDITDASGAAGAESLFIQKTAGAAVMVLLDNNGAAGAETLQIDNAGNVTGRFVDLVAGAWTGTASEGAIHFESTAAATIPAGRVIDIEQLGSGVHAAQILGSGIRINEDATGPAGHTDANNSYAISVDTAGGTAGGLHLTTAATEVALLLDGEMQLPDNQAIEFGTAAGESALSSNATNTVWTLTSGTLRVGPDVATNYAEITTAGQIIFAGTGRRTKSEFIPASSFLTHAGAGAAGTQIGAGIYRGWALDAAADEAVVSQWLIPDNVVAGTCSAYVYWASGTGASDVVWDVNTVVVADTASLTGAGTTNSVTDTGNAGANTLNITAAMTTATLTAGSALAVQVNRDANNAADTLAADAVLLGVRIDCTVDRI